MPVTKSEMLFFAAGVAVGATVGANFSHLKEKFGPIFAAAIAGASSAVSDSRAEVADRGARSADPARDVATELGSAVATNGATKNHPV